MKTAFLLLALALPGSAFAKAPPLVCPQPVRPSLFISPMGEPFRPTPDANGATPDPVRRWFDQADRDHDGKLTIGEMMLDADRFFATLDTDHNGELLPDEVGAYEENVAPEVHLYQARGPEGRPGGFGRPGGGKRGGGRRGGGGGGGGPRPSGDGEGGGSGADGGSNPVGTYRPFADGVMGAGRFSFLNIPNPVASADDDINRAVSRTEFRSAAAERFRDLDPNQKKVLTFADLPQTPAQIAANAACLKRVKEEAKAR